MVLSTFTFLMVHQHHHTPELLHLPKLKCNFPLNTSSHSTLSQPLIITILLSVSMSLTTLQTSQRVEPDNIMLFLMGFLS